VLTRSHGLGNDYLVLDPAALPVELTPDRVRLICDRHRGVGSDGILALDGALGLRIFNPDGSEAEKSGNGLRIFAKWLYDTGRIQATAFNIPVGGAEAPVELEIVDGRAVQVTVDMGRATFRDDVSTIEVGDEHLSVIALSIGNPHCVLLRQELDVTELRQLGPLLEHHPLFANRTNVQLARAVDRANVELLIWERGAGETQASGSSACAVVAACNFLGLVDDDVTATMPGGELHVRIDPHGTLFLRGPAEEVATIILSPELIARLQALP
jgi:diaminopimelate epimerase